MKRFYDSWQLKLAIFGMIGTMAAGLVYMTMAYANLTYKTNDNQSEIMGMQVQIQKVIDSQNAMQTDIGVVKFQVIEIGKKLDRLQ